MAPPRTHLSLRLAPMLALAGLACQGLAGWRAGAIAADTVAWLLAAVGALMMLLSALWSWRMVVAYRHEMHRERLAAGRAFDSERAMQQAQREAQQANELLAQANESLSRQSTTDGLTGIANRRMFDQTLAAEWQRAARAGTSVGLLLVDIDHFKRFNDYHGHVAGDECLRRVTHVLASCVRRAGELLARYGGEEFVLLLPGADLEQARDLAQRCLHAMHREAIPHGSSPTQDHVTFSIGVAQVYPSAARDPESLVNAADTAMYRAKTEGRARYAVAGQADWEIDKDAPRSQAGELS